MSVIGVDPGLNGALAIFDQLTGSLHVVDMPTWSMQVGRKVRQRVDPIELLEFFELAKMGGAQLCLLEQVGGRPKQSAGGGFTFGASVGMVYMACIACRIPCEMVAPQTWKKLMKVPGKKADDADSKIMIRAQELFPDARTQFYGPKGGKRVDRAEAAMLARYAAQYALGTVNLDPRLWAAQLRENVNAL